MLSSKVDAREKFPETVSHGGILMHTSTAPLFIDLNLAATRIARWRLFLLFDVCLLCVTPWIC